MTKDEIKYYEDNHYLNFYPKKNIVLDKGKGAIVWDIDGNEYIDCIGSYGTVNVGHCCPPVVKAISKQSERLIALHSSFYNKERAKLIKNLLNITPSYITKFFFCNSGAEAIEAAIKVSVLSTKRKKFLAFNKSFHGRTIASLSLTYNKKYKIGFEPLFLDVDFVSPLDIDAIKNKLKTKEYAALFFEPVQGEGGIYPLQFQALNEIAFLCKEHNTLLVADEIQTGFCRTGKFFAVEHSEVQPDIICMAKSLGGGVPVGAIGCKEDNIKIEPGKHGNTFGGNPLVSAAANAAIEYMIENKLVESAKEKGNYFIEKLKNINSPLIREVRGLGLMIGIELKKKTSPYIQQMAENGVLVLTSGNLIIRLLPPLVITKDQIDKVVSCFNKVLNP